MSSVPLAFVILGAFALAIGVMRAAVALGREALDLRNAWISRLRPVPAAPGQARRQLDTGESCCEHTFVTSPDDIAIALDTIGDQPIDPTNAALMGLRKALQRGLATEDELVSAARDHLRGSPDAAA